jgi:hypothetical protein
VVSIWVLRDRIPHNPAPLCAVRDYRVRDSGGNILHDYPVIAVIELQNWIESAFFKEELERWLCFFAHGEELSLADELPPSLRSEVFMKAVNEMKRINDSMEQRMAYNSRMDKIRWKKDLEIIAEAKRKEDEAQRKQDEAQRKQDEAQRKQDEAQRKQDEAFRQETEAMRQEVEARRTETERLQREVEQREAELKTKLETAFRGLVEAGQSPEDAAKLLGSDSQGR